MIDKDVKSVVKGILKQNIILQKAYRQTISDAEMIKKDVVAPCEWCKYDGDFRCDACADNFFEGYNIRNYPD